MLYDPQWEKKVDALSLDNLISWLERQPSDGAYTYECPKTCMLSQYLRAQGFCGVLVGSDFFYHDWDDWDGGAKVLLPVGWASISRGGHKTFGAALHRARAYRAYQMEQEHESSHR